MTSDIMAVQMQKAFFGYNKVKKTILKRIQSHIDNGKIHSIDSAFNSIIAERVNDTITEKYPLYSPTTLFDLETGIPNWIGNILYVRLDNVRNVKEMQKAVCKLINGIPVGFDQWDKVLKKFIIRILDSEDTTKSDMSKNSKKRRLLSECVYRHEYEEMEECLNDTLFLMSCKENILDILLACVKQIKSKPTIRG